MAPKHRIIIDTDPGVDDTLALLLALSAKPTDLIVELISVTYGNVPVQTCLRNVVTLFHQIGREMAWRESMGKPSGFEMLKVAKPLVAVGAGGPLADQLVMADYFHGVDGLGGIYESHPHFSPKEAWRGLFGDGGDGEDGTSGKGTGETRELLFTPARECAADAILRLLRENEKDSITIVAIGPLTNLAIAAARDTGAFLRAKDVVVMGGALRCPGNVTPVAEFNTYADSVAAARVYALTSRYPRTTMPPVPPAKDGKVSANHLGPYPDKLSRRLRVTLFPLDITTDHWLRRGVYNQTIKPYLSAGSPLAAWTNAFLTSTFQKMESLHQGHTGDETGLSLHDPLCIWYLLTLSHPDYAITLSEPLDLRVETSGQWTRGMYVLDQRDRFKKEVKEEEDRTEKLEEEEEIGDAGRWLDGKSGNRILVAEASGGRDVVGRELLRWIWEV